LKKKSSESEKLLDDEEDDAWLDEPAERYEFATLLEAEMSHFLDINSKQLATFLADTKDKTGNSTITDQSLNMKNKSQSVANQADDNDFSINFD
jgi:hypothetical protein